MTNIEVRTHNIYPDLSNAEKKVADFFLANIMDVFTKSIGALACESGVSKASWVRFCKSIGFDGLRELKQSLYGELYSELSAPAPAQEHMEFGDIRDAHSVGQLIQSVSSNSVRAILDTEKLLDPVSLENAARQLLAARSVRIFGVGASGVVGEDLYNKLLRIDRSVYFSRDIHLQLTYAANMTPRDAAVLISLSGHTREILEILAIARRLGTPTVAITRFDKNALALGADTTLYLSSPETSPRSGAMSSRIAQMMVVDVLFSAVAHLDYENTAAALERSRASCRTHLVDPKSVKSRE